MSSLDVYPNWRNKSTISSPKITLLIEATILITTVAITTTIIVEAVIIETTTIHTIASRITYLRLVHSALTQRSPSP